MKQLVKKLVIRIFEKINIHHILNILYERQNNKYIQLHVTNHGAIFYPEAVISNAQDKSKIIVGSGTHIRGILNVFKYGGKITIGENCYVGDHTRIWSGENITIGNFVQISHNVNIMDTNAHEIDAIERAERYVDLINNGSWTDKGNVLTAPIVIGDYAWISFNATILKGVTIGEGAIVGANAVVTKDVPGYTLVTGNPARIIKNLPKN
jgi:acetyltransferase-like isoleucine patch superfamily enzyme